MNHPIATDSSRAPSAQLDQPPGVSQPTAQALTFPALLDRMTPVERLRAYRSGAFTAHERSVWAARFPEEAPLLNGEFEWIARSLADLD
jgi:hypothetical protein